MPLSLQNAQSKLVFSILCLLPYKMHNRQKTFVWVLAQIQSLPPPNHHENNTRCKWFLLLRCFNPKTNAENLSHCTRFDCQSKRSLSTLSTILSICISGELFCFSFLLLVRFVCLLIRFPLCKFLRRFAHKEEEETPTPILYPV